MLNDEITRTQQAIADRDIITNALYDAKTAINIAIGFVKAMEPTLYTKELLKILNEGINHAE